MFWLFQTFLKKSVRYFEANIGKKDLPQTLSIVAKTKIVKHLYLITLSSNFIRIIIFTLKNHQIINILSRVHLRTVIDILNKRYSARHYHPQ